MYLITGWGATWLGLRRLSLQGVFGVGCFPGPLWWVPGVRCPKTQPALGWSSLGFHCTMLCPCVEQGGHATSSRSPTHCHPYAGRARAACGAGPAPATGCNPAATGKPGQARHCRAPTSPLAPCFAPSTHGLCAGSSAVSRLPPCPREAMLLPHGTPSCAPPLCLKK